MNTSATEKVRAKRFHDRARYDAPTVHAILDAMPLCTVAYVFGGQPYATTTLLWRENNHIYWHGSSASRMLKSCEEAEVCVTVAILDGMVMAKSAFNHSCNYRSVMALGKAFVVTDFDEKKRQLQLFTNQLFPGRWEKLRPLKDQEVKATMILGLSLDECSAKIRTGMPNDDAEDQTWPIWTGVIPITMRAGAPIPLNPDEVSLTEKQKNIKFPFFNFEEI